MSSYQMRTAVFSRSGPEPSFETNGVSSAALAQTSARADWPKSLSMGMIPTDGDAETLKGFASLEEYLSKKLGVPVTMKVGKDYASVTSDMGKGDLNFAYFGPASYISAAATAGAETLVKESDDPADQGFLGSQRRLSQHGTH